MTVWHVPTGKLGALLRLTVRSVVSQELRGRAWRDWKA